MYLKLYLCFLPSTSKQKFKLIDTYELLFVYNFTNARYAIILPKFPTVSDELLPRKKPDLLTYTAEQLRLKFALC